MTEAEFRALYESVSNWGRWGKRSDRGALNYLTPERVARATGLVRSGITVSLSKPLDTERRIDNPEPADHRMTMMPEGDGGSEGLHFAKDYIGADYHNEGHSHIDAFSHVAFDGVLYDGTPVSSVTADGAGSGAIDLLENGLVARGVLLDIPGVRGVPWLEPGDNVMPADVLEAEEQQGVLVEAGDVLLVRTGHVRRQFERGHWDTTKAKAGMHPTIARFLAERSVVALGSDGNNDTAPSAVDGIGFPIHVLTLNAMGVHLFDYLQLEDLLARCEAAGRWEFLLAAAPLRIAGGTGSPLNPIAVF
jgi:kynurenine formamidase